MADKGASEEGWQDERPGSLGMSMISPAGRAKLVLPDLDPIATRTGLGSLNQLAGSLEDFGPAP